MKHRQKYLSVRLLALAGLLCTAPIQGAWAQTVNLGAASDFAALGGAGVTCTTGGVVGDVGSASSTVTTITGFPPTSSSCTLVGNVLYSPATDVAYANFGTAYTLLAADGSGDFICPSADAAHNLPLSLNGLTLPPGVYCIGGAAPGVGTLSGELTLNGGKDAVWIFKTNSLTTTAGGSVVMAGGGKACNVYWQTDFEATFANTDFLGTILAGSSISFTNSTLVGRALAGTDVTLDTSFITLSGASAECTESAGKEIAIEYFHSGFAHYFVTAITDEIAKLDGGVFSGWVRTGQGFNVYSGPGTGLVPVCRFFTIAFPPTSSHFYAPRGLGCEGALANEDWQFEGDVFYTPLPDTNGGCPSGTLPIYRLYNNGQGGAPNHRFTTSEATRAQMLANGYIAEGTGVGVGMCSPSDR